MTMVIGIVNYGVGNIGSLVYAFKKIGVETMLIERREQLKHCDVIVLPGVGSFDSAMKKLREYIPDLKAMIGRVPVMGICLGMQLMFESSEEGSERGLSWFPGRVTKIRSSIVPHIGWNTVSKVRESPLLEDIPDNTYFYFAHSYCIEVSGTERQYVAGVTEIGESRFVSVLSDERRLIFGTQFHPERSSKAGLRLLANLVKLARR